MKGLATFALLISTALAVAIEARTKSFSCPDKTWGGCCAERDENLAGKSCKFPPPPCLVTALPTVKRWEVRQGWFNVGHDAASVGRNNEYTCANKNDFDMCCHFAPWLASRTLYIWTQASMAVPNVRWDLKLTSLGSRCTPIDLRLSQTVPMEHMHQFYVFMFSC